MQEPRRIAVCLDILMKGQPPLSFGMHARILAQPVAILAIIILELAAAWKEVTGSILDLAWICCRRGRPPPSCRMSRPAGN